MRILFTIVLILLAAVSSFINVAIVVMAFRNRYYPGLQEFDVGGLMLALILGTTAAICAGFVVYKLRSKRKLTP